MELSDAELEHPHEALFHYAQVGDANRVRAICELGLIKEVDWENGNGVTALMAASLSGHVHVVETLVGAGADVRVLTNGCDALIAAAQGGHADVARFLLSSGADTRNCTLREGNSALHLAASRGYAEIVELLILAGADVLAHNKDGLTALHVACGTGQARVVAAMAETLTSRNELGIKVAMLEKAQPDGSTPIMIASGLGHLSVVAILAGHGADALALNQNGFDAFMAAINGRHLQVVEFLLENNLADIDAVRDEQGNSALHIAVMLGEPHFVELLIRAGADVLAQNSGGVTAFYVACARNQVGMVRRMVETLFVMNADELLALMVAKARNDGVTPVIAASAGVDYSQVRESHDPTGLSCSGGKRRAEVLQYLLEIGADVGSRSNDGITPLLLASQYGCLEAVNVLLSKKAELECKDSFGRTALWHAVYKGHVNITATLLRCGADVNTKDAREDSPLHISTGNGRRDIVELLLRTGAYVDAQNVMGSTPLLIAACEGYVDIAKMLLACHSNLEHQPRMPQGGTAVEAAAQHGHLEIDDCLGVVGLSLMFKVTPAILLSSLRLGMATLTFASS